MSRLRLSAIRFMPRETHQEQREELARRRRALASPRARRRSRLGDGQHETSDRRRHEREERRGRCWRSGRTRAGRRRGAARAVRVARSQTLVPAEYGERGEAMATTPVDLARAPRPTRSQTMRQQDRRAMSTSSGAKYGRLCDVVEERPDVFHGRLAVTGASASASDGVRGEARGDLRRARAGSTRRCTSSDAACR